MNILCPLDIFVNFALWGGSKTLNYKNNMVFIEVSGKLIREWEHCCACSLPVFIGEILGIISLLKSDY